MDTAGWPKEWESNLWLPKFELLETRNEGALGDQVCRNQRHWHPGPQQRFVGHAINITISFQMSIK